MRDVYHGNPIGMSFIIGSATTYKGKPPSYDLVYLDPETMLPVDLETYAFDLDGANANDTQEWKLKIDHKKDYDLSDLSPRSFLNLSERIKIDEKVCQKYRFNTWVGGPASQDEPCKPEDRDTYYC